MTSHIPSGEPQHGITCVAFSRVTKLENLGIEVEFSCVRFTDEVRSHALVGLRQAEEKWLGGLAVLFGRFCRAAVKLALAIVKSAVVDRSLFASSFIARLS